MIDNRYGPAIPQAFESIQAALQKASRQATAYHARPIDTMLGDFNIRALHEKTVWSELICTSKSGHFTKHCSSIQDSQG